MNLLAAEGHKIVSLDPKKFKLTISTCIQEEEYVEMIIKIKKMEQERFCVEFIRKSGDHFEFFIAFAKIRATLAILADTTQ